MYVGRKQPTAVVYTSIGCCALSNSSNTGQETALCLNVLVTNVDQHHIDKIWIPKSISYPQLFMIDYKYC